LAAENQCFGLKADVAYVGSVEHVASDVLGDDGDETGCAILLHCPVADEHRIFAAGEKNAQVHNAKKRAGKVKKLMPEKIGWQLVALERL